jgi:hypothetical protein
MTLAPSAENQLPPLEPMPPAHVAYAKLEVIFQVGPPFVSVIQFVKMDLLRISRFFMWPPHEFPCLGERNLENILQGIEETSLAAVVARCMIFAIRLILR